jgi:transposase InsO family protein
MRQHGDEAPSVSTIERVLERHGCLKRRRRRPGPKMLVPAGRPTAIFEEPNDLWTVDFKGWWRARDGAKCEPLTVRDAFSRYILAIRLVPETNAPTVQAVFKELFDEYGVPRAIQSDNGPPFASTRALAGLTKLSAWWVSLGIELVRSRPACPQDNGAHERMHADMQTEIRSRVADTRDLQQLVCDEWRVEFNHVRPHEALAMATPSDLYRRSPRRPIVQTGALRSDCERRTVDARGWVVWNQQRVYVTTALRGHTVGLLRVQNIVTVWFYQMMLGTFRVGDGQSVQPVLPPECHPVTGVSPGDTPTVLPGDTAKVLPGVTEGGDTLTPLQSATPC